MADSVLYEIADACWIEWHAVHPHAKGSERVLNRIGDHRRDGQRTGLAGPFHAERVQRTRRGEVEDLQARHLAGRGERVVQEAAGERLALLVEDRLFIERVAEAVRHAADDLALDQQ